MISIRSYVTGEDMLVILGDALCGVNLYYK